MALDGHATAEGTRRYRDRMVEAGVAQLGHFRQGLGGVWLSSIGLGTYLGGYDAHTDDLYDEAIKAATALGCHVLDSAINYRCQRSERVVGRALADLIREKQIARDEVVIATKGGYLPFDDTPPRDSYAYILKTFVHPGVITASDIVADCHCMTPAYLRHQIETSCTNLNVSCIDIYYLHNPETQLDVVSREEFVTRIRGAFTALEQAVSEGRIGVYGTATWTGFRQPLGNPGHLSLEELVGLATQVGGPGHHFRVIQLPYNLGMPEALVSQTQTVNGTRVSLLEAAKALDVYVMASAAILQGRLTRGLPTEMQQVLGQGTDAQRAIQFVRSTPGLGTALVGMKQSRHVHENLAVSSTPPLSPEQFTKLFK